jgi:hypothetical protein
VISIMSDNEIKQDLMWYLAENAPVSPEQLGAIVRKQRAFLEEGGGGGKWATVVAGGMVFAIYRGPPGNAAELRYKKLEGLDLRGLVLPYSEWIGSLCRGQDLSAADLTGSVLTDVDFTGTSFRNAKLARTDFSRSRLINCDLQGADLTGADLENADFSGADLRGAMLGDIKTPGTIFTGARRDG